MGLWALILIWCSTFSFLVNVGLRLTLGFLTRCCLAHCLQLALVVAATEVGDVHHFFSNSTLIVNVVTVSPKRHDPL